MTGNQKREVLAFVHIEKAAGTTLLYLLRRNFLGRYMDVRPLCKRDPRGVFTAQDLTISLRLNPWLRAIGGHAVLPTSDLTAGHPPWQVRYLTLLRDPVARYLSQFRYWNRVMGKGHSFERFLDHEKAFDLQTRKIAGCRDPQVALDRLERDFWLVGTVDTFDEFLLCLDAALPEGFNPSYRRRNSGDSDREQADRLLQRYGDAIVERNAGDIKLLEGVKSRVLPRQREQFPGSLDQALKTFRARQQGGQGTGRWEWPALVTDAALRKAWYEPASGLLRVRSGLPAKGSY